MKSKSIQRARTAVAVTAAKAATVASRATGRGAGGMIGGLVAGFGESCRCPAGIDRDWHEREVHDDPHADRCHAHHFHCVQQ